MILIVGLIHMKYQAVLSAKNAEQGKDVSLEQAKKFFPQAVQLTAGEGGATVTDELGLTLGLVVQTSPQGDSSMGFAGPSNLLLAFDRERKLMGISVLESRDTPEHVEKVLKDAKFFEQFQGLTWDEARDKQQVDAVSGATLTSLAMVEALRKRLGGAAGSLRFPQGMRLKEVRKFFPKMSRLAENPDRSHVWDVWDEQNQLLGHVTRSAPAADNIVGYQGPSDTLLAFDTQFKLTGLTIQRSYETKEYVKNVVEDTYFPTLFVDKSLDELAQLDLAKAQVEGVSGATMTSMAMARGLVLASQQAQQLRPSKTAVWRISSRDVGTILVTLCGLLFAFTHWRGSKYWRWAFQAVLVVYLGFINGDLLSQSLLAGWAQAGLPYRSSLGMVVLTAAALLVPVVSKKQFYCHQICPFGVVQEWAKQRSPWKKSVPARLSTALKWIPLLLLGWVILVTMRQLPYNLSNIEPFNAFLITVAGWGTLAIAVVGIIASFFVPMAYCHYGCPTGALLNFLRYNAHSHQFTRRDLAALALLLWAVGLSF